MYPEIPSDDDPQKLEHVTEEAWGRYAFAREPLEQKFTPEQKDVYTAKANACGHEWAKRVSEKYGTKDPKILAEKMGMKVKTPKVPTGGGVVLFAQYVQPDEITIFTDCVEKAAALETQCLVCRSWKKTPSGNLAGTRIVSCSGGTICRRNLYPYREG